MKEDAFGLDIYEIFSVIFKELELMASGRFHLYENDFTKKSDIKLSKKSYQL